MHLHNNTAYIVFTFINANAFKTSLVLMCKFIFINKQSENKNF